MNAFWHFLDNSGTFVAKNPHKLSRLYFPLANEAGLLSSITPTLHGDIKIDQDTFLTVPCSTEDIHETRYNRNFWAYIKGFGALSLASGEVDESMVEAGLLWHKVIRINKHVGIRVEFINFIPANNHTIEIMLVKLTNVARKKLVLTPTAAIPVYARSADRLRDHRHVSSLFNRIDVKRYGVKVTPVLRFDEQGHKSNSTSYFIFGCDDSGAPPTDIFSTIPEFTGEGGNLDNPEAVLKNLSAHKKLPLYNRQGKEAIGGLKFKTVSLKPGRSKKYIILMGIIPKKQIAEKIFIKYNSPGKIADALQENRDFWINRSETIRIDTGDRDYNMWFKWVTIQPILRKLFGCSFLPDFDYGRGGRGWRDLWQDCLTLILINPKDIRKMLIDNFGGVREDGTNATIIGKGRGKFISDRNRIARVWMDHGLWPFITLNLYINQTGDINILFEKVPYLESNRRDTILAHLLCEHRRPFTKLGKHGHFLLEGGDWNDGLDMAKENGESVAFTAAYAGNLTELTALLEKIHYKKAVIHDLYQKAQDLSKHIRKHEWITTKSGYGFFNGYYDNKGKRLEGDYKNKVRMTLTGQVFPIMSGVATNSQVKEIYRSAKRYLWDKKLKGFRLNTDFGKIYYPEMGRAFSFAYGEKENGSFFSHMNIMFAYALYKRNFVREGFEVLNSIYNMCLNTRFSKIYPGLPEYFNSEGRGMYHYLTGSASWLVLTMVTQVFGILGKMGDLTLTPKLTKKQFKNSTRISIETYFAGRRIKVNYLNPERLDYGRYTISQISINGNIVEKNHIKRETFLKLTSKSSVNDITVSLTPRP